MKMRSFAWPPPSTIRLLYNNSSSCRTMKLWSQCLNIAVSKPITHSYLNQWRQAMVRKGRVAEVAHFPRGNKDCHKNLNIRRERKPVVYLHPKEATSHCPNPQAAPSLMCTIDCTIMQKMRVSKKISRGSSSKLSRTLNTWMWSCKSPNLLTHNLGSSTIWQNNLS